MAIYCLIRTDRRGMILYRPMIMEECFVWIGNVKTEFEQGGIGMKRKWRVILTALCLVLGLLLLMAGCSNGPAVDSAGDTADGGIYH